MIEVGQTDNVCENFISAENGDRWKQQKKA